jgi:hypothetical protein
MVPIPDKTAAVTTQAFEQHVLTEFGCCAEMLTNAEFQGVFVAMLYKTNIDHQMTNDAACLSKIAIWPSQQLTLLSCPASCHCLAW